MRTIALTPIPENLSFRFLPDANRILGEQKLQDDQSTLLRRFLWEQTWPKRVLEGDLSPDLEVTQNELNQALADVLEPERRAKRNFLRALLSSNGDREGILAAYNTRKSSESECGPMIFNKEDLAPYQFNLVMLYEKIFQQAMAKEEGAKALLKILSKDFSNVAGADFRIWLGRRIADTLPEAMQAQFRNTTKNHPERFAEFLDRFFDGEDGGRL